MRLPSPSLEGTGPPSTVLRNPASLFSPWVGIILFMFPGSLMLDPHRVLYSSGWENSFHKPLPIGNITGLEFQLLHFKIHHCIYSKATLHGLLPVDGWQQVLRQTHSWETQDFPTRQHWFQSFLIGLVKQSLRDHITVCNAATQISFLWSIIAHQLLTSQFPPHFLSLVVPLI